MTGVSPLVQKYLQLRDPNQTEPVPRTDEVSKKRIRRGETKGILSSAPPERNPENPCSRAYRIDPTIFLKSPNNTSVQGWANIRKERYLSEK